MEEPSKKERQTNMEWTKNMDHWYYCIVGISKGMDVLLGVSFKH